MNEINVISDFDIEMLMFFPMFSFKYSSMSARNQYSTQIAQIAVVFRQKDWTIDASCAGYENFRARVSENRWTSGCPGGCDWRGVLLEPPFLVCFSLFLILDTCQQKTIKDYKQLYIHMCLLYFQIAISPLWIHQFLFHEGFLVEMVIHVLWRRLYQSCQMLKVSDVLLVLRYFFALLCFSCLCFFWGQEMTQPNFLHSWSYVEAGR